MILQITSIAVKSRQSISSFPVSEAINMLRTGSVLVTGANRGLGLEFIRQLVKLDPKPKNIIAICRNPDKAEELNLLASSAGNVHVVKLDVRDYASYDRVYTEIEGIVGKSGLDLLINNAAVGGWVGLAGVTPQNMLETFEINVVAPLMFAKKLLPLIKAVDASDYKRKIVNITSSLGSISDNTSGGYYPYRTSKAALNMVTKSMAVDLNKDGILCIALHPGWVQTDMGGENAHLKPFESVSKMIKTIGLVDYNVNGLMLSYDGKVLKW